MTAIQDIHEAIDGPDPEWYRELSEEDPMTSGASPLEGAVKVDAFPETSRYPFAQIADDGGVWRLDPDTFQVTPGSLRTHAGKWARKRGLTARTTITQGYVYVQFRRSR